jgi:cytochrome bd-type quinol oxidase subunit 2
MTAARPAGLSRLLVVIYAIFAIAATARSVVQLATRFDEAPVAYALSAVAAAVYVVATFALAAGERGRRLATYAIGFELAGVLIVGTLSLVVPDLFPRATVWSNFGLGYLLIPLALPIVGLWWLRRTASTGAAGQG